MVNKEFIKRDDTYNIALGGGNPPKNEVPVYQYDLNGNFVNCYDNELLAAKAMGGKVSASIIIAMNNKCCAFESFWSKEKVDKLDISTYKNTIQRIEVHQYDKQGNYIQTFSSMSKVAKELNVPLHSVQKSITAHTCCHGYYFSTIKMEHFEKPKVIKHTGKIYQYSLDGKYLNEFDSCLKVVEFYNCNTYKRIPNILREGLHKCGDFLWDWNKYESLTPHQTNKKKKVGRYDTNGNLLEVFQCTRDARKEYSNVSRALSNKAKHCKGFIFKYIE